MVPKQGYAKTAACVGINPRNMRLAWLDKAMPPCVET
jgi:L,D-peptidoglycan transpeptidase YkuD (ErfK/YbiS/YcfS/YnhG family)